MIALYHEGMDVVCQGMKIITLGMIKTLLGSTAAHLQQNNIFDSVFDSKLQRESGKNLTKIVRI